MAKRTRGLGLRREQTIAGLVCAAPFIIGFLLFTIGPIVASFVLSFHDYEIVNPPTFAGLANYRTMFEAERESYFFWKSMYNTLYLTFFRIVLTLVVTLLAALLLNLKVKGVAAFRTIFYIPSIVPLVASCVLWMWILNARYGLLNITLSVVGISGPPWLGSPAWSKPSMVLMHVWSSGSTMLVFLAGLQAVPEEYHEAAIMDGAGVVTRFFSITLPLLTPTIFFNAVILFIQSMQTFQHGYIMTEGGPDYSTLFYVLYLYQSAFRYFKMGYASALAWVLFMIILAMTLVQMKLGKKWVFYQF